MYVCMYVYVYVYVCMYVCVYVCMQKRTGQSASLPDDKWAP